MPAVDSTVEADTVIDMADAWFSERGRGWSLGTSSWLGADQDLVDAALRRGMKATSNTPGMVCYQRVPDAPTPDGIELRALNSEEDHAAFTAMLDLAYASRT